MFNIGDKVVYPMHGAGIIEAIEEKEILGERQKYYVMRMPIGDMKVMVPLNNVENIGLREVVDHSTVDKVLERMKKRDIKDTLNWNRRYRANLDKMRSGDIYEVADVVRSLMVRDEEKGLSTGERKMLENAKQILISELALARDLDEAAAFKLIDGILSSSQQN
ncbi:CarD family transcriptional regulator [Thermoactinomyces sp. CICC 10521]|uniref:CarD family transcriptional regulator n=1 Tax=Thermoactinomyces daqus TaxID=1329516 RepID=A0A7W2AI61_9BACL|nr:MULTISPECIES: CarD family transcriptional regulator [unclassified Thermoactinomyces]MBA4542384.1 CarD family transcriptional regulator [Thermoactinomyces daqus]MBH8598828.1 CarD family transcriptional regulator [Thermoactinomyces sp. CICC 10523]MBH8607361.1 CarD family transcriptional regulator [Thermoactinomyces sp. CICC 10521]